MMDGTGSNTLVQPTPVAVATVTTSAPVVRQERIIAIALAAVVMLVAVMTVTPWPVGAYQDDALYTILAKALAEGEGYRMINLPGAPHATHYPPGYPLFLSLLWRLSPEFPDNVVLFKFANAVWLSLAALGAWTFARRRLQWHPVGAAAVVLAGTLCIMVLLLTGVVLSEPMFMAMLFPTLLLCERAAEEGTVRAAIIAAVACGALAMVRTLGTMLVPAVILVMLHRRWYRATLVFAAVTVLCLLPWQLWVNAWQHEIPEVLHGKYGDYGSWVAAGYRDGGLAFAREMILANIKTAWMFIGYTFMPVSGSWPRIVAFVILCLLTLTGFAVFLHRARVAVLFVLAYMGVVLLWPFEPSRFVIALWPLLTLVAGSGILAIWRWRTSSLVPRLARMIGLACAAIVIGGFGWLNAVAYSKQWWASIQRDTGRRAKPVAEWIAAQTNPSDVITVDDDLLVFLYTGRRATPTSSFTPRERLEEPTDLDNIAAARALITHYAPRYYITTSEPGRRAADSLSYGNDPLLRRYRLIPNAFVYERIVP